MARLESWMIYEGYRSLMDAEIKCFCFALLGVGEWVILCVCVES